MPVQQYKTLILVVMVVLALFAASPALQQLVLVPQKTHLTEFSVLGPYHNATYPFDVASGEKQALFLDVTNHLGSCAYYQVEVKFRNETQSAPDSFNKTNSALSSLGDIPFCLADNQTIELPVTVSFSYNISNEALNMQKIIVNGFSISTNSTTIAWDPRNAGYYGNLFLELWVYNETANAFQYNQRYVSLWLDFGAG